MNDQFRRSHFHLSDIPKLIMLQSPVRCLACRKRQYVSVMKALGSKSVKMRFAGDPKVSEVWRDWMSDKPVLVPSEEESAPAPEGPGFAQANPLRERPVPSVPHAGGNGSIIE